MGFIAHPSIFHENGRQLFDSCGKCGKDFKEGEKIYKRARIIKFSPRIIAYWCERCYNALYI